MANTDGPDTDRTKAQPGRPPASPAGTESKRGETLPQARVTYTSPKQGLPPEFGRYRVKKLLGGGGMGAVYLVVNTELEREEALKVPHFDAADDPMVRERFLREAKSAAKLDHPNLCPVYDVGVLDGVYYLTMRYLKGKLLSEYSGMAQPPRKAVEIVTKLAQALTAAHAKGVIHRDLKPNNIMMCAGVGPVVMDFGLAKQAGRPARQLTQLGTTLGTPAYMPPEQVKGELDRIGPASDVYSLGVILFELLTGRLPFEAGTAAEVYGKILYTEAPAPSSLRPELPPVLDAICVKAMAKAPEGRYGSMKEFAAALIEYLKATPPTKGAEELKAAKTGPSDIFQMPTVVPARATPPLRPSGILAAATQIEARARTPSPVRQSNGTQQGNLWAAVVAGADEKRGGRSSGALFVWALCGMLMLGGLGGIGALVYILNQKKADDPGDSNKVAATTPQLAPHFTPIDAPPPAPPPDKDAPQPRDEGPDKPVEPPAPAPPPAGGDTVTNTIGMKLNLIQPGKFLMGSPKDDLDRNNDEKPQHEVEITKAFYMGVYPVTKGEFAAFVKDDGYQTEAEKDGKGGYGLNTTPFKLEQKAEYTWQHPGFPQGDDHPVVEVSWNDATAFCAWLSKKEGKTYELPTEAEWEYACRAGTTTAFSFPDPTDLDDYAWYGHTSEFHTHPVGGKKPNPWGLYDMHGNVCQWCADGYDKYQEGSIKDPKAKESANSHVWRGGSWLNEPRNCRSAYRNRGGVDPAGRYSFNGFRVVLRLPVGDPRGPAFDDKGRPVVAEKPRPAVVDPPAAPAADLPAPQKWCAIAYSEATRQYGDSNGYVTSGDADAFAIKYCKAFDAKVIVRSQGGWCALAITNGTLYSSANGATDAEAKQKALSALGAYAAQARIAVCISANR